ncbi:MAG: hypothetical protein ACOY0T_39775 [Myxococcota bacterium]
MKTRRLVSSVTLMVGIGLAQLVACSSDSRDPSTDQESTGTLRLPLQTVSTSGKVYRLRNATFTVVNSRDASFVTTLSTEDDPTRNTLSSVLTVGEYTLTLLPGWTLERVLSGDGSGGSGTGGSTAKGGGPSAGAGGRSGPSAGAGGRIFGAGGAIAAGGPGKASGGRGPGVAGTPGDDVGSAGEPAGGVGGAFEEPPPLFGGAPSGGAPSTGFGGSTGSVSVPVRAELVSNAVQPFTIFSRDDSFVTFTFQVGGEVLEFNQGRVNINIDVIEVGQQCETPSNVTRPERVLLENDTQALAKISLRNVFLALANNGDVKGNADVLFNQIYDSYATADVAQLPDAVHCGDEVTNGVPSLNGYPIACNRRERLHVGDLDNFRALAVVNRIDLAPQNGANCGQQRMIFGTNTQGRAFMIVEAQIPNPRPELGIQGCLPLAQFWFDQNSIEDAGVRGDRLAGAFLTGDPGLSAAGFGPFYNPNNLTVGSGQIRTNQFDSDPWTLREFKLTKDGETLKTIPFPTAEAPNGQLWNENNQLPQGEACRANFLNALEGLLTPDTTQMSFIVDQQCRDSESRNDKSQFYAAHMTAGFSAQLEERLAGTGISAIELANRAQFAGSCIGCHMESSGAILGLGVVAPPSLDFPHVTESPSADCGARNAGRQCFPTSVALKQLFLPSRLNTLAALVGVPIVKDPCENEGGGGRGGAPGFGGSPGNGGATNVAGSFGRAGRPPIPDGGAAAKTEDATPPSIDSQGPAPNVVVELANANAAISELLKLDSQIRSLSGARTIGGRSAQATH